MAFVSALPASNAQAQLGTPGLTITTFLGNTLPNNGAYGFEFSISTAITVTDLGFYDYLGDGLASSHEVKLWTASGTLLATAVVPSGTGAPLLGGGFRFVSITPVTLLTGENYVVSGESSGKSDAYVYNATISTAPGISYIKDRSRTGNSGDIPGDSGNLPFSSAGNFGANFAFVPFSAIPEPSTALAAIGLLGLSAMSRWRSGRAPAL